MTSQFNSRHTTKMDVQEEAIELACVPSVEKFFRRYKDFNYKTMCVQKGSGRPEHARIIVHDRHDFSRLEHKYLNFP